MSARDVRAGRTKPAPRGSGDYLEFAEPPSPLHASGAGQDLCESRRTATSGQPPHESCWYSTWDHLLSRVPPNLGPDSRLGNAFYRLAPDVTDSGPPTLVSVKLKLDLHDIYNRGQDIERALRAVIDEAVAKKAPMIEIIPGKGSGQLKKRVLRFLDQKEIKALYHRVEKDSQNFGRLFVHFRWK